MKFMSDQEITHTQPGQANETGWADGQGGIARVGDTCKVSIFLSLPLLLRFWCLPHLQEAGSHLGWVVSPLGWVDGDMEGACSCRYVKGKAQTLLLPSLLIVITLKDQPVGCETVAPVATRIYHSFQASPLIGFPIWPSWLLCSLWLGFA